MVLNWAPSPFARFKQLVGFSGQMSNNEFKQHLQALLAVITTVPKEAVATLLRRKHSPWQLCCTLARVLKPNPQAPSAAPLNTILENGPAADFLAKALAAPNVEILNLNNFFGEIAPQLEAVERLRAENAASSLRVAKRWKECWDTHGYSNLPRSSNDGPSIEAYWWRRAYGASVKGRDKDDQGSEAHKAKQKSVSKWEMGGPSDDEAHQARLLLTHRVVNEECLLSQPQHGTSTNGPPLPSTACLRHAAHQFPCSG